MYNYVGLVLRPIKTRADQPIFINVFEIILKYQLMLTYVQTPKGF